MREEKFSYVMTPYSHPNAAIRQERYELALLTEMFLLSRGEHPFVPIIQTHELAQRYSLPYDVDFWWSYNQAFIDAASFCYLVLMPDWDKSVGITKELNYCRQNDIIVSSITMEALMLFKESLK